MSMLRAFIWIVTAGLVLAQPPSVPSVVGSIRGTVRDAMTGAPLEGAVVRLIVGVETKTDAQGRYEFRNVTPGAITLTVTPLGNAQGNLPVISKLELAEKQDATGIEIRVRAQGEISGKVTDDDGNPVAGLVVWLVPREYALGEMKYVLTSRGRTDDTGMYTIRGVNGGRGYLLLGLSGNARTESVSTASADVAKRASVFAPTYYPGTELAEGALPVVLRPGEQRQRVDFRVHRSLAYCAEGVLQSDIGGEPLRFELTQASSTQGSVRTLTAVVNWSLLPASTLTGPDGRFRVCDLTPGRYRLAAYSDVSASDGPPKVVPRVYGTTEFAIVDRDVKELGIVLSPHLIVPASVDWESTAGQSTNVTIRLNPLTRMARTDEKLSLSLPVAGAQSFEGLLVGDYEVQVSGVGSTAYVKDMLYAGQSARNAPLRVGSAVGGGNLRVLLAHDGGRISVRAADREGNSVVAATIVIVPANATSELALASAMKGGATDQSGQWTSGMLAPGKYYVLATLSQVDFSPESVARVWNARAKSRELEITAGATAQVTLTPGVLE